VAGIEQDAAALVLAHALEEAFEAGAVVQVFAGLDFVAEVDAVVLAGIEDRPPAARQLIECCIDQARRRLR